MKTIKLQKHDNETPRGLIWSVDVEVPQSGTEMAELWGMDIMYKLAFDALKVKLRADLANIDPKEHAAFVKDYVPNWNRKTADPEKAKAAMLDRAKKLAAQGDNISDLIKQLQEIAKES